MRQYESGLEGERQAERFLTERCGMTCLARRYRAEGGELDLVMADEKTVVFVEVKARPGGRAGEGLLAITPGKRQRLLRAARAYLLEMGGMDRPVRFDVVEITRDGLRHIPNAFGATG